MHIKWKTYLRRTALFSFMLFNGYVGLKSVKIGATAEKVPRGHHVGGWYNGRMTRAIDFSKYKKICVIGAPGSGKSFFSRRLSEKLGCGVISLDDLRYVGGPIVRHEFSPATCRRRLKNAIDAADEWIVDGTAWHSWTQYAIEQCDVVVVLRRHPIQCVWRVWVRSILEPHYRRPWHRTRYLMGVAYRYERDRLPIILGRAVRYHKHVIHIRPTRHNNRKGHWVA